MDFWVGHWNILINNNIKSCRLLQLRLLVKYTNPHAKNIIRKKLIWFQILKFVKKTHCLSVSEFAFLEFWNLEINNFWSPIFVLEGLSTLWTVVTTAFFVKHIIKFLNFFNILVFLIIWTFEIYILQLLVD